MNNRHMRNLSLLATASVAALVFFTAGCNQKDASKATAPVPPPTVIVAEVDQRTVPIYSEYVGQTKAEDTVELRARVEGILLKVYFKEGMPVKKGQLLFTIDKRPFEANLLSASAVRPLGYVRPMRVSELMS